jgi:hypothetical protein
LVIGYWLLVISYWLLVIGYWLLVISYYLLLEAEPLDMYSQAEPGNKTKSLGTKKQHGLTYSSASLREDSGFKQQLQA